MKLLKISLLLLLAGFIFPQKTYASEFSTEYEINYDISKDGTAKVVQEVILKNLTSTFYDSEYTLNIGSTNVSEVQARDSTGTLKTNIQSEDISTKINVSLGDKVIGLGKTATFTVSYTVKDFAKKLGKIWEINIPKVSTDAEIGRYDVVLSVPSGFGSIHYITPKPNKTSGRNFFFDKLILETGGVRAAFGEYQIFNFDLTYHLYNPNLINGFTEIAFPPDTTTQGIEFKSINPSPVYIREDEDGNYLARYNLGPKEKLKVNITGLVKIVDQTRKLQSIRDWGEDELKKYLKADKFWEANNPELVELAKKLKTPKAIYDFVSTNLKYNYDKINSPKIERLGALRALKNPNEAICMEYTDLFIALARAADIPARELNGFAYTENRRLRPTTLKSDVLSDVLHAWPEYYDRERKIWVQIDPTWGSTTSGLDYFDKLDTNHIVFAIKGVSSEKPTPAGAYKVDNLKEQDIKISFSDQYLTTKADIDITVGENKFISGLSSSAKILIANRTPRGFFKSTLKISSDDVVLITPSQTYLGTILPFGNNTVDTKFKNIGLFKAKEAKLKITVSGTDGVNPFEINKEEVLYLKPFFASTTTLIIIGAFILSFAILVYILILEFKMLFASKEDRIK